MYSTCKNSKLCWFVKPARQIRTGNRRFLWRRAPATRRLSRNGLSRERDRGLEFGPAMVASPEMVDPAGDIKAGTLGEQQAPAAKRAIRPLQSLATFRPISGLWRRVRPSGMRGRDHHGSPRSPPEPLSGEDYSCEWRHCDTSMKVLWPQRSLTQSSCAAQTTLNNSTNWCRSARNWCAPRARSPQFWNLCRARGLETSRAQIAQRQRKARPMKRGGWCFRCDGFGYYCRPRCHAELLGYPAIVVSPQGFEPWTP